MSDSEKVKVDAIVVGGGPAGLAAALAMAREGLEVIVVERGEYAGAKNVGGLFYGTVLNQLLPGFFERAPIERTVSRRSLVYLGDGQHASIAFGSEVWSEPPCNNTFVVFRSQFDRWLAKEVEAAGASLLEGTVVEDLVYEEGGARKAVGVRVRGDEEFFADVVVLAEGATAMVTEKASAALDLRGGRVKQDWALGVKEIIGLPKATIEDRFLLEEGQGVAIDFIGTPFDGLIGGGFLYTGKEALHLGFAARVETLVRSGVSPNDIMERFKSHPIVRRYIAGGETLELSAHRIPEGGFDAVPDVVGNGVLIAGDAAGLVNMSLYKEGTNHAMESGKLAGETVVEARKRGDFSKASLAVYEKRLREGVGMKDLEKGRDIPRILAGSPNLTSLYPRKVTSLLVDLFTVSSEPKAKVQRRAVRSFLEGFPKARFALDAIRARKLL